MGLRVLAILYSGALAGWILSRRHPRDALLPLLLASLVGVPLLILGNSSAGGVFATDIALAAYAMRFARTCQRQFLRHANRHDVLTVFAILAAWATLRSIVASFEEPAIAKFVIYGSIRWWLFFACVVIFFGQKLGEAEYTRLLKGFGVGLFVFAAACISHQKGLLDLSGADTLGTRATETLEQRRDAQDDGMAFEHRRFLAMTSPNTAGVCISGIWVAAALLCRTRHNRTIWALLAVLLFLALAGTWSRSDMVGLIAALCVGIILFARILGYRSNAGMSLALILVPIVMIGGYLWLVLSHTQPDLSETPTIERYATVFQSYSTKAEGTGAHRIHEHTAMFRHVRGQPALIAAGLGANGYKRLAWDGVATMGFGHNIYLHTICELGLLGVILLSLWLWLAVRPHVPVLVPAATAALKRQQYMSLLVLALLVQRLVAGWGADTILATGGMLEANILFLAAVGTTFAAYGPPLPATERPQPASRKERAVWLALVH
ncbi:MAG: O-antigen ligase family protein [Phycisphaerae bacterium]|nr:O-antigen ligase family protein [Phycisphaerae bacterium]